MKTIPSALLALLLATPFLACAQEAAADQPATAVSAGQSKDVTPGKLRKKLKFRDRGPVCMCVGGLTEADIKAGRVTQSAADRRGGTAHE